MDIYFTSFLFYLLVAVIGSFLCFLYKGRFNIYVIILLTLIFGLRKGFGHDYEQYVNIFNVINIYGSNVSMELGAIIINVFSYQTFGEEGYHFVFVSYTFLTLFFVNKSLKEYDCDKYLVIVIFLSGFIFFSNNAIRQALAISFLMCNIKYLESSPYKYIASTLFSAIFFHYSAFIYLSFIFLPKTKISRLNSSLVLLVSLVVHFFGIIKPIFIFIVGFIPYYGSIYLERVVNFNTQEQGFGLVVILWYLMSAFFILHRDKVSGHIYNIYILGNGLFLAGIQFEMWERIFIPFFYLGMIVLALLIKHTLYRSLLNFFITTIMILTLTSLTSFQIMNNKNKNKVVPFDHVFLDNPLE